MVSEIFEKCDGYLDAREGTYQYRCRRYDEVIDVIQNTVGLGAHLTIADIGAGWTEFGHRLTERGFRGRYLPYDGAIDGKDLQFWQPPMANIDVCVAIEFLEHVRHPERVAEIMFDKAKLTVITTPHSEYVDTLGMDEDHVIALDMDDLWDMGFTEIKEAILFPGSPYGEDGSPDTLVAWRYNADR